MNVSCIRSTKVKHAVWNQRMTDRLSGEGRICGGRSNHYDLTEVGQPLTHAGIGRRIHDGGIKLGDDVLRRAQSCLIQLISNSLKLLGRASSRLERALRQRLPGWPCWIRLQQGCKQERSPCASGRKERIMVRRKPARPQPITGRRSWPQCHVLATIVEIPALASG